MTASNNIIRTATLALNLEQIEELLNATSLCDLENNDFTTAVAALAHAKEELSRNPTVAEHYLKHDPAACPACKGRSINGDEVQIDNTTAFQDILCMDCGAAWQDNYSLSSISHTAGFSPDAPYT